jgi:6-phosphogluconolactonase
MSMTASPPILHSFATASELCDALATFIVDAQKEAIERKGRFTLAISGGSLPKQLNALIDRPGVKWENWSVLSVYWIV